MLDADKGSAAVLREMVNTTPEPSSIQAGHPVPGALARQVSRRAVP